MSKQNNKTKVFKKNSDDEIKKNLQAYRIIKPPTIIADENLSDVTQTDFLPHSLRHLNVFVELPVWTGRDYSESQLGCLSSAPSHVPTSGQWGLSTANTRALICF